MSLKSKASFIAIFFAASIAVFGQAASFPFGNSGSTSYLPNGYFDASASLTLTGSTYTFGSGSSQIIIFNGTTFTYANGGDINGTVAHIPANTSSPWTFGESITVAGSGTFNDPTLNFALVPGLSTNLYIGSNVIPGQNRSLSKILKVNANGSTFNGNGVLNTNGINQVDAIFKLNIGTGGECAFITVSPDLSTTNIDGYVSNPSTVGAFNFSVRGSKVPPLYLFGWTNTVIGGGAATINQAGSSLVQ